YISTVNGFLADSPVLCSLLDRQSGRDRGPRSGRDGDRPDGGGEDAGVGERADGDGDEAGGKGKGDDAMDGMAYDMMMGNYNRVALFANDEEKSDAADVLNAARWRQEEHTADGLAVADASATADSLVRALQQRMKDLEKETCRRLISWEDEKHHSALGGGLRPPAGPRGEGRGRDGPGRRHEPQRPLPYARGTRRRAREHGELDRRPGRPGQACHRRVPRHRGGEPHARAAVGVVREPRERDAQAPRRTRPPDEPHEGPPRPRERHPVRPVRVRRRRRVRGRRRAHPPGGTRAQGGDRRGRGAGGHTPQGGERHGPHAQRDVEQLLRQPGEARRDGHGAAREGRLLGTRRGDREGGHAHVHREEDTRVPEALPGLPPRLHQDHRGPRPPPAGDPSRRPRRVLRARRRGDHVEAPDEVVLREPARPDVREDRGRQQAQRHGHTGQDERERHARPGRLHAREPEAPERRGRDDEAGEGRGHRGRPERDAAAYRARGLLHGRPLRPELEARRRAAEEAKLRGRQKERRQLLAVLQVLHIPHLRDRVRGRRRGEEGEGGRDAVPRGVDPPQRGHGRVHRQEQEGRGPLPLARLRPCYDTGPPEEGRQAVGHLGRGADQVDQDEPRGADERKEGGGLLEHLPPPQLPRPRPALLPGRQAEGLLAQPRQDQGRVLLPPEDGVRPLREPQRVRRAGDDGPAVRRQRHEDGEQLLLHAEHEAARRGDDGPVPEADHGGERHLQTEHGRLPWMDDQALFSNISRIRKEVGDADVPIHVPRAQFVRTLQKESSREIMREKIGVVYARMEKHLSESGGLLPVAWKALVKVLYEWFGRWEKLSTSCYKFILEPSAIDVVRIAKSASGSSSTKKTSARTSDMKSERHNFVSI
ncbi:hypothetical protein THAOC_03095, partial [Thalassiosira oceanica]